MQSLDILYMSLAICAFLLVGILAYLVFHLVQTIKSAKVIIDDVADIAEDVKGTKNFLKRDVLGRLFGLGKDFLENRYGKQKRRTTTHHTAD